jgi:hypothetical protein
MRGLRDGAIAAAVFLSLSAGGAVACQGGKVLFEDHFDQGELQSTWEGSPDSVKLIGGRMVISAQPDWAVWVPNTAGLYDDIDLCADVTTVHAIDPTTNYVGLVFWYADDKNFYTVETDASGEASIWRKQRDKWLAQVAWTKDASVRAGDGATNQLRVVTKGNTATFYINGTKFRDITGQPPANGQEIGMIAYSPKKGTATYAFANVEITQPE